MSRKSPGEAITQLKLKFHPISVGHERVNLRFSKYFSISKYLETTF